MSTHYGNREPNGCGGCLAAFVVIAFFATAAGACWQIGAAVARAVVA
ncbi:hypothetical protein [Eggerthella guodeyinii]|uniref:Uncharacterized protein n=1 Tax=Eggerthella guodeyinii TaxID=2690837 RepID=A0A6N7RM58_9ACTN|nr:hypothetical protein [Eggerthella guodeyinii]MRX82234.1 hypothetical protein [Eggerthella guodeyinii]